MDSYRTFVAIELPRELRAKLIEHAQQLRQQLPDARASWSREDNLHLTLKFLGNIPGSEIPKVSAAIARAVSGIKPFELTVAGSGVFPPKGKPNVLWIGVEDGSAGILPAGRGNLARTRSHNTSDQRQRLSEVRNPQCAISSSQHPTPDTRHPLLLLHSTIEDECADAGFAREPRSFHPHLTIARLRRTGGERRLAKVHQKLAFPPESFSVSEVVVFKSELLREGSKHTPISRHDLQD